MGSFQIVAVFAAAAGLCACATSKTDKPDVQSAGATTTTAGEGGVVLGSLGAATLPGGQCGMLLWTTDGADASPVFIFRYVAGGAAQVVVNGKPTELARVETEGATGFGVAERQKFTSGAGLTVEVSLKFGTAFEGGTWLQNGYVAAETADGWRTVAPAAGIAGCRPK